MGDGGLDTRTLALIAVVAFVVGAVGIVAAAHLTGTVEVSGPVPVVSPDGMNVTVTGDTQALLETPFPVSSQVDLVTEDGNATFTAAGTANLSVAVGEITGEWTNVSEVDPNGNAITIDPADKPSAVIGKNIDNFSYRSSIDVDDGQVDFVYGGASGNSRVTVQNVPNNVQIFARDAVTGTLLDAGTASGNAVTFDELDNSQHPVLLQTGQNTAPVLTNPQPTGVASTPPNALTVDVNDAEFPDGDSVTAELYVNGNKEGEDTLTSNGTASVSFNAKLGTTYDYTWNATDSFGAETKLSNSFSTAENVTFRNETNASQIVTGVNATIIFYAADATVVVEREDSNDDGNISLSGLPAKEFVAVIEADGYYNRRAYIESIANQQSIFLLNNSAVPPAQAINTTFVFEDRTGKFPPENTTLRIQRALDPNNDGNYSWMTIAGDFWGAASEFPFTGEFNARYRLIVENPEGDRRVLGTHIPVASGTKTVINGEIRFEAGNATGRFADANLSESAQNIQVLYQDPTNGSGEVRVRVWELGNRSNEIHDSNYTNTPYGRLVTVIGLTADEAKGSWIVKIDTEHDEDGDVDFRIPVGGVGLPLPVDPWLLAALGVVGTTFVAVLYGPRTATGGAWVLVFTAAALSAFGWVGFPVVASIVPAAVIAAAGTFYKEALP